MIAFTPPYQVIQGHTVLPDHADPQQFYVLPSAPQLAQREDGRPALALVQYLGGGIADKIAGGLLTLTTKLSVADETLAALRGPLADRLRLASPAELRLSPVLFDSGTVELIALGAASTPSNEETDANREHFGPFEVRFLGVGKPALSGENTASFQLLLDANAAELLEQALAAPDQPLIMIYRMTLSGLRPNFQIDIQADWHKVYRSIQNKAHLNVYYVSADAESMITEALEASNIRIDTTVFGADESARAAAARARQHLLDWLMERLFTPVIDPAAATANAIGNVVDNTVSSLVRSVLPGLSYKLRLLDEEQLRLLSVRMNEAVAEPREIVPQATIGGSLYAYQFDAAGQPRPEWPTLRQSLVQKINLDGFPRLEVNVAVEDRFVSDGLSGVQAELARPDANGARTDHQTLFFRSANEREAYVVNLLGRATLDFAQLYQYRTTVHFAPTGPFGAHDAVTSEWRQGTATELFIEPQNVYTIHTIQVGVSPIFSFAQFPQLTIELRYGAEGEAALQTGRLRLNEQQQTAQWRFRSFLGPQAIYEYRVTYHRTAAQGGDITSPWRQAIDDWLAIADPLPTKHTLNLLVNLPWAEIELAFVRLRYQDEVNNIAYDEQLDLLPTARTIRRDYPIAADGPRTVAYQLTIFLVDGSLLEGSWRETSENRLLLDRRLVDRKVVRVRTIGGTLVDNRLREVRIQLQVRDPASDEVQLDHELILSPGNEQTLAPWEYLLGDPPRRTVHFTAAFIDRNGFIQRAAWQTTEADLLVVNLKNMTMTA